MAEAQFRPGEQHPEPWRTDLNPDPLAGENHGPATEPPPSEVATAYDLKAVHQRLAAFNDAELKAIRVLEPGTRLEQGATYIDLQQPAWKPFTALGNQRADWTNWYVAKHDLDYVLWNRLIGVDNPERLDEA